jgi:tripartite-type tricarboxylate transporter receptor subunit TctC
MISGLMVSLAALTAATDAAQAAPPERLTIVVPFAAGGGIDIFARLFAEAIGKTGTTVIVEDRPGASSMIGTDYVARAQPDGATVLISSNSTLITPLLRKTQVNPLTDLNTICLLAESPQVIAVAQAAPYRDLKDLVAAARAAPGKLTIGSNGPASTQHLVAELFKHTAGIDMTYVPYNGGAPAVNAVLGNQVTAVSANYSEVHGQIEAGQLRALGTTLGRHIPSAPDIATAREQGFDFDIASWHGISVPAKTPPAVVEELRAMFMAALQSPELRAKLAVHQYLPTGLCGEAVAASMKQQSETIGRIAATAGIKLE